MIKVDVRGIRAVELRLAGMSKQVRFATAKALTQTAHAANKDLQRDLQNEVAGGATPYTLRAFEVEAANKVNLTAKVRLRKNSPPGGTPYDRALAHLFEGGRRDWKKLEGWLLSRKLMPEGMMVAPGPKAPLDRRGNFRAAALREMLGILASSIRNLRSYRKSGGGKAAKGIGFFVALPGDRSGVAPGIWRRIETGSSSAIEPWVMFIRPTAYRKKFDLDRIGRQAVARNFQANFSRALADAIRSAR